MNHARERRIAALKAMDADELRHEAACILEAAAVPTELVETLLQPGVSVDATGS